MSIGRLILILFSIFYLLLDVFNLLTPTTIAFAAVIAISISLELNNEYGKQRYENEFKHLRDEVAGLSQEVSRLREEIRRGG